MTDSEISIIRQIADYHKEAIGQLREDLKELQKAYNSSSLEQQTLCSSHQLTITKLSARVEALELWQRQLTAHLESISTEKKSWIKDVVIATIGACLAYLAGVWSK